MTAEPGPVEPGPVERGPVELGVVIPVRDDAEGAERLVSLVSGLASQVVVVDDGSARPLRLAGVEVIRHETPRGAGTARNTGLDRIVTRQVMFLDADDRITPELALLLADLEGVAFDVCQFKYADGREARAGHWGQPGWDEHFWCVAGVALGALNVLPDASAPLLAQTANYPWNKVLRTGFLRDNGIGFAGTRVHNDLAFHWRAFMAGERILASDRICVLHEVRARAGRLTNAMGVERAEMPLAAAPAVAAAAAHPDPAWRRALATFLLGLDLWIADRLAPGATASYAAATGPFFAGLHGDWGAEIAGTDPALAARLAARAAS